MISDKLATIKVCKKAFGCKFFGFLLFSKALISYTNRGGESILYQLENRSELKVIMTKDDLDFERLKNGNS